MLGKTIHIIIAILFFLFAAVQYNDPDPLIWILIYGSVAFIAMIKIYLRQLNYSPLIITLVIIISLYSLFYIPVFIDFLSNSGKFDLIGKMGKTKPWIEGTREFFGLLLSITALLYLRKTKAK